ncbi:hypothetical protein JXO59_05540 [candidate division KSB1 bacterium]|nr:hypothetical protein [candidate division KSB1 bacterium]
MTLVQFDSQDPYEVVHRFKKIQKIDELTRKTYVPRASTPLLDAMGRGINDLEKSIADLKEDERPAKVMMVIITDGQENASREFRKDQIIKMIKEKQEKLDWQFVFLSADLDAIGDARALGFQADAVLMFAKSTRGVGDAWASLNEQTLNFRASRKKKFSFDPSDRKHPEDPDKDTDKA